MSSVKMAPEIVSSKEQWINSDMLTLEGLRGYVVLVDFWTYSCVNCLRTLPAIKEMHGKYRGRKVVMKLWFNHEWVAGRYRFIKTQSDNIWWSI